MASWKNFTKTLTLATIPWAEKEINSIENLDGTLMYVYHARIISLLAQGLGASFNIVTPIDHEFGTKLPNGSWNGIINMLLREEVDLTVSGFRMTEERTEAVNFTYPIEVSEMIFMTDNPVPQAKSFAIFNIFSCVVWITLGMFLVMISFIFYLFMRRKKPYLYIVLRMLASLFEEPFPYDPQAISDCLLLMSWFLGVAVLIYSYKALILSAQTFPAKSGIRNIEELSTVVTDKSFKCIAFMGTVNSEIWMKSNDVRLRSIAQCLKRSERASLYGIDEFLEAGSKRAFIGGTTELSKYKEYYFLTDEIFSTSHVSIAYSRKFCCPKQLERTVHRIVAAGLFKKFCSDTDLLEALHFPWRKPQQLELENNVTLSVEDLYGAFLVLLTGHVLGVLILVLEYSINLVYSRIYLPND